MADKKPIVDELDDIAETAEKQRLGAYTTESDAMAALMLIQRLAAALADVNRGE